MDGVGTGLEHVLHLLHVYRLVLHDNKIGAVRPSPAGNARSRRKALSTCRYDHGVIGSSFAPQELSHAIHTLPTICPPIPLQTTPRPGVQNQLRGSTARSCSPMPYALWPWSARRRGGRPERVRRRKGGCKPKRTSCLGSGEIVGEDCRGKISIYE